MSGNDWAFEHDVTASPEHIDELGHVNNAVWVSWIQDIAVAHWNAIAPEAPASRASRAARASTARCSSSMTRAR